MASNFIRLPLKISQGVVALTTFMALVLPTAIYTKPSAVSAESDLKVGGIFDLTSGAGGTWGRGEQDGFQLALEEFRAKNHTLSIQSVIEDSAYNGAKAVTALQKIMAIDGVHYVIGPTWEVFASTLPVCERNKIICIAPSFNNAAFDNPNLRYSYTLWFDERDYGVAHLAQIKARGAKRVALITGLSPYYVGIRDKLVSSLPEKPVVVETTNPTERDFRSIILRIPKDLDALMVFLLGDGAAQAFFRQWSEIRSDRPPLFTDDALLYFDPPLDLSTLGFEVTYTNPQLVGDRYAHFKEIYTKRFGKAPASPSVATAYDATNLLLTCLEKVGDSVERVRECLDTQKDFPGASGLLSFSGGRSIKERAMSIVHLPTH